MLAQQYTPSPNYLRPVSAALTPKSRNGDIKGFVTRTVETSAGFYFYFPDSDLMFKKLAAFVAVKRKKHPRFVFGIQVQEDILLLEITAPMGMKYEIMKLIRG